jgi:hypothetical protein
MLKFNGVLLYLCVMVYAVLYLTILYVFLFPTTYFQDSD